MNAIILCGGKGTRLGELTKTIPKPMLPIKGKPLLEYQIEYLKGYNITDIILAVGHLKEVIMDYFGNGSQWGVNISYSIDNYMGTGGALKYCKNLEDNFIVMNGDTLLDVDLDSLARTYQLNRRLITIAISKVEDNSGRYGIVDLEGFKEKEVKKDALVSSGLYMMNRGVIEYLPEGYSSLENDLFPFVDLGYYIHTSNWVDIGIPETYEQMR